MDQHPIPQDVTGFQFKLIGTMTVKQFGYVAVGAILAAISWYLPTQGLWLFITRGIFVPFFSLSGVIIAFVPIEGRPVDVMAKNFLHSLLSPNQYIYIKKGRKFSFTQINYTKKIVPATENTKKAARAHTETKKEEQLRTFLAHTQSSKNSLDKKEDTFLNTITAIPTPPLNPAPQIISPRTSTSVTPTTLPAGRQEAGIQLQQNIKTKVPPTPTQPQPKTPAPTKNSTPTKKESLANQEVQLQQELTAARQQEAIQKNAAEMDAAHQKVLDLQKQIQDTHAQKEQLEQELLRLRNQLSSQKPTVSPTVAPSGAQAGPPAPHQDAEHVRNIPRKNAGFSQISDTPNVIVGIVKDARGNMLPNILVEVKDKNGNPVRAFKTNTLGQFISATPLKNDTYTIELEDPKKQHAFDAIQINASGQIMLPIEIISHDAREELRKALFN